LLPEVLAATDTEGDFNLLGRFRYLQSPKASDRERMVATSLGVTSSEAKGASKQLVDGGSSNPCGDDDAGGGTRKTSGKGKKSKGDSTTQTQTGSSVAPTSSASRGSGNGEDGLTQLQRVRSFQIPVPEAVARIARPMMQSMSESKVSLLKKVVNRALETDDEFDLSDVL
jgi:hypothetical protein